MRTTAVRGGAVSEKQYATLRFTNISAKTCALGGYAGVQLLRGGQPLGKPASTAGVPVPLMRLAPGRSVTAELSGPTTCNADVSDKVRISLPNAPGHVDKPLLMRACPLVVAPFHLH
ncbi:MAG TPA: DUF4232 domain-containing protein [Mycobacterium sp.]|jgi:hypothetical protein|nr:DUF4232 domain-containing protein [Mycobacterium sp.]